MPRLGQFGGELFQRTAGDGFAGEEPVNLGELLAVGVVVIVVLGDAAFQRVV